MLRQWLEKTPKKVLLPDPTKHHTPDKQKLTEELNDIVEVEYVSQTPGSASRKRKRGEYVHYTPEQKAKIARYAIDHGATRAARHFSDTFGKKLNESTVRSMKASYLIQSKNNKETLSEVVAKPRGRPKLIGDELDTEVCDYIRDLRDEGGCVNTLIVQSIGRGVLLKRNKSLLPEYGGKIDLSREWARSVMDRLNFKKRKATKGIKHLPADFEDVKREYLNRIETAVKKYDIPDKLIINWDQTGLNVVPTSEWTMDLKGSKQVKMVGLGDKRQITALLSVTKSGHLLPPQLIYPGKTDACHPKVTFPDDWDVTHTESHWGTEDTMIRFAKNIIIPYVESVRESLSVKKHDQQALAIFDVFKAHRSETLLSLLRKSGISYVFVPASCTDQLQPLDQTINKRYKDDIKKQFQLWYADEFAKMLKDSKSGEEREHVKIDLRTSVVKPLHAKWVIKCHQKFEKETDFIKRSFEAIGLPM